jgi:hypothetical protein
MAAILGLREHRVVAAGFLQHVPSAGRSRRGTG